MLHFGRPRPTRFCVVVDSTQTQGPGPSAIYNVDMEGAIVFVDRSTDRANRTDAPLSRPEVRGAKVVAIYDLPARK